MAKTKKAHAEPKAKPPREKKPKQAYLDGMAPKIIPEIEAAAEAYVVLAMGAVRDQVLAIVDKHEREAHGGQPCMGNRASAIAYLAHCLAVRREAWHYAETLLADYDATCEQGDCRGHS